jgi:hypothetical protein
MYVIIGSHFVPLEGRFLLIALVIVRITLNVSASNVPKCPLNNGVFIIQKLVEKVLTYIYSVKCDMYALTLQQRVRNRWK